MQEDDDGQEASKPDPRDARRQREVAPKPPATPKNGPTREDVIQAVQDWVGVDRADTVGIIASIKKNLGIEGQLQNGDFPKVIAKIAELKDAGVNLDTLGAALMKKGE